MALAESWHLRSRSKECAASGTPFTDGQTIVTALFPDPESSGYVRKDFSPDAWSARTADDTPPFSFWKATFHSTVSEEKPEVVEKESAESLLKRLVEEDEDHTENVRYILAVMLERQKLLRETDTQRMPNGILRVYEHRKSGDVFIIRDPDIPLSQVDQVQEEIILMLENGGRAPAPVIEVSEPPSEPEPSSETTGEVSATAESNSPNDSEEDDSEKDD